MVYQKNLLQLQIIKKWIYDSSVNGQPFLPRYCDSLRQDWQRKKVCLQGSGTNFFFLCLAIHSFSEPLIKCVPTRSPSPFSCSLLDRSTARRSKYPSTVAQESGFKVQSFHQLKSSSCSYFSYWTNAEPGRVQLFPRACPAKYVWQSCLGISFWSAHWSDGSDFKYLLNFLQGECNFYAECHLSIEVVS